MVKAAILGFGVVGSGVAEVLSLNEDKITRTTGGIELKYIVDIRDFPDSKFGNIFTKDFADVENDPEVKVVVETIGGVGVAYQFTKRALEAGKCVVTSNKELVATHGVELMQIAKENGASYYFEACVGGGVPIIRPLAQCLAANAITEVYGILNGTTNYILTQMIRNNLAFDVALKQAQALGYAEQNPAADVEGHDVCRKICILSAMCFGQHIYPEQVVTEGIMNVTKRDVDLADKYGYKIKLLGRTFEQDGKTYAYVAPHLVSTENLIAGVEDVMNGIVVKGNAVGTAMFYGPGAGKMPTASAVVADVMDAARHIYVPKAPSWVDGPKENIGDGNDLEFTWYVRTKKSAGLENEMEDNGEFTGFTQPMTKAALNEKYGEAEILNMFRVIQ